MSVRKQVQRGTGLLKQCPEQDRRDDEEHRCKNAVSIVRLKFPDRCPQNITHQYRARNTKQTADYRLILDKPPADDNCDKANEVQQPL